MPIRRRHIRSLVHRLLETHGIEEPPVDVAQLARDLGIIVQMAAAEDDLSGLLVREHRTGQAVIGVNQQHSRVRQRFTIAHELGHFLLHRSEAVHVDGADAYQVKLRHGSARTSFDPDEREANLFAAELLMPDPLVDRYLQQHVAEHGPLDLLDEDRNDALLPLARKFDVSTQALAYRLADLGYINL